MDKNPNANSGKRLLAVSTLSIEGIPVYETEKYYLIFLGMNKIAVEKSTPQAGELLAKAIVEWHALKVN